MIFPFPREKKKKLSLEQTNLFLPHHKQCEGHLRSTIPLPISSLAEALSSWRRFISICAAGVKISSWRGAGSTRQGELCCSELCNLQVENKTYDFLLGFCKWLWASLMWQQCPFSSSCRAAGCSSTPCLEFLKTFSPDTGPLAAFSDGDVLLAARVSVFIVLVQVACPEAGPDCKTSSGFHLQWGIVFTYSRELLLLYFFVFSWSTWTSQHPVPVHLRNWLIDHQIHADFWNKPCRLTMPKAGSADSASPNTNASSGYLYLLIYTLTIVLWLFIPTLGLHHDKYFSLSRKELPFVVLLSQEVRSTGLCWLQESVCM